MRIRSLEGKNDAAQISACTTIEEIANLDLTEGWPKHTVTNGKILYGQYGSGTADEEMSMDWNSDSVYGKV